MAAIARPGVRTYAVSIACLLLAITTANSVARADAGDDAAAYLTRISVLDDAGPTLNAVIVVNPDAPSQARQAEAADLPLAGRTVLVKDNIETHEWPTTAGSLALAANLTGRDAPLITRLRKSGGVILGKANLSEWANFRDYDSTSGWSAVGGLTRNPHAIGRNACGSSSGSGAAVAAGLSWAAIGTETDGSIVCPASVNGVVGFKPTVGLVSRTHIIPISRSQDTAGPMTRTVHGAALLLNAIAGADAEDPATADADRYLVDFTRGLESASLEGERIGVMRRQQGTDPGVVELFERALSDLARTGATLVDVDYERPADLGADEIIVLMYEFREGIASYLASTPAEVPMRNLNELIAFNERNADTEMRWFGQDIFEAAAATVDRDAYESARERSLRLAGPEGIDRLLREHDVHFLIAPTRSPAWPSDLSLGDRGRAGPPTGIASLPAIAGYPHLTVPMGAVEGLPVGLSIVGTKWADHEVLQAGAAFEAARTADVPVPALTLPESVR